MLGTINVVRRLSCLCFENAFVRQGGAFNEGSIQRRAKDVRLGTLRDG
jgi:hypothetical protein